MEKLPKKSKGYNKMLRRASVMAAVAAAVAVSGIGVYAAINYLSPAEVADELNYPELARQFEVQTSFTDGEADGTGADGGAAAAEPESITSGDYTFTFLGITSGADLTAMHIDADEAQTYAVVAIENADGTPFDKETYYEPGNEGIHGFFVSPLIHGREPWKGGAIAQLGGAATEEIIDGKIYRLVKCDNIEIFADTGVSLAISTGAFYNTEAFDYNPGTGLTTAKDFDGASAVFEMPLDPALGDPAAAAAYWENFEREATQTAPELPPEAARFEQYWEKADWTDVTVIEGTTEILTPDENGMYTYVYEPVPEIGSGTVSFSLDNFTYEIGVPLTFGGSETVFPDGTYSVYAIMITVNEDNTVKAELVTPNNL
jgi:hypothetical protein